MTDREWIRFPEARAGDDILLADGEWYRVTDRRDTRDGWEISLGDYGSMESSAPFPLQRRKRDRS